MEKKQIALITGVGRAEGLGYATAKQLAGQGYTVIITARDQSKIESLATSLRNAGEDVHAHVLDVNSNESVRQLAVKLTQQFEKLDVLINNAAIVNLDTPTINTGPLEKVQEELDTNFLGVWRVTEGLLPLLKKSSHARIVNVSSGMGAYADPVFGLKYYPVATTYGLSKLILNGFTIKTAQELKADNILVNAVCPGFTATHEGLEAMGARPVSEGAKSIAWAANIPANGPTGGFFRDGVPLPW